MGVWFWVGVVLLLGLLQHNGHKIRKARGYAVDAHDAADVFLYRDSSIATHNNNLICGGGLRL